MKRFFILAILVSFLAGCGMGVFGDQSKTLQTMSPKEKAIFFMKVYNAQFDNYQRMAKVPNLSDEQKKILQNKKQAIEKAFGFIQGYNIIVNSGGVPDPAKETMIINLLDDMAMQAF